MMTIEDEFSAYDFDRAAEYLKKKGIPQDAIDWCAAVNALVISATGYIPTADAGQGMIATPVHDRGGEMVNIVAFEPQKPAQWYLRHPRCSTGVLGLENLYHAITYQQTIVVHDTPADWLKADRTGCCPLHEDAYERFMGLQKMKASPALHAKIVKHLQKVFAYPQNEI